MKFIASSSLLLKELQMIGGIINNTTTLPILENFMFDINNNNLTLTASDLETTFSTQINIESKDSGRIALPAKLLLDTLKTFPDQPLTFLKTEKNTVEISANSGKYSVAYIDGDEFPLAAQITDSKTTVIPSAVLHKAINSTLFATGNDDLRPVMSGVFFQFDSESLKFIATDAHKLVKYTRKDLRSDQTSEFIMPKKPLQLLRGILQGLDIDITIEYNDTYLKSQHFHCDNNTEECKDDNSPITDYIYPPVLSQGQRYDKQLEIYKYLFFIRPTYS